MKGAQHSPIVAFGGSYGGMLASWMRAKYPQIIIGLVHYMGRLCEGGFARVRVYVVYTVIRKGHSRDLALI